MKKYYIASGLENAGNVRVLKKVLDQAGWEHTYDWTVHGAVDVDRLPEVAKDEEEGVAVADVVIVLLPGGRGTHTELGIALAFAAASAESGQDPRICVFSANPGDFEIKGQTCAFYHHPCVERFTSMDEMIDSLLKAN